MRRHEHVERKPAQQPEQPEQPAESGRWPEPSGPERKPSRAESRRAQVSEALTAGCAALRRASRVFGTIRTCPGMTREFTAEDLYRFEQITDLHGTDGTDAVISLKTVDRDNDTYHTRLQL